MSLLPCSWQPASQRTRRRHAACEQPQGTSLRLDRLGSIPYLQAFPCHAGTSSAPLVGSRTRSRVAIASSEALDTLLPVRPGSPQTTPYKHVHTPSTPAPANTTPNASSHVLPPPSTPQLQQPQPSSTPALPLALQELQGLTMPRHIAVSTTIPATHLTLTN